MIFHTNKYTGTGIGIEGVYANHPSLSNMHPVGRLDADTSGLLLFSKEGSLTQPLLNPQSGIPRTYEAIVLGSVVHNQLKEVLVKGVQTTDGIFGGSLLHSEVLDIEVCLLVCIFPCYL